MRVGEIGGGRWGRSGVSALEVAAGLVVGAELDGDAGADADEGGEGALVEGEATLVLVDGCGGVERGRVLCGGLETDLDNVKGLSCVSVSYICPLVELGWRSSFTETEGG